MNIETKPQGQRMTSFTIGGRPVPDHLIGELDEADATGDLAAQLEQHGYLLLRGVRDADEVLSARREVLARLVEVGEVAAPAEAEIATGQSRRAEMHPDLGAFWKSVSEGPALRRVITCRSTRSSLSSDIRNWPSDDTRI